LEAFEYIDRKYQQILENVKSNFDLDSLQFLSCFLNAIVYLLRMGSIPLEVATVMIISQAFLSLSIQILTNFIDCELQMRKLKSTKSLHLYLYKCEKESELNLSQFPYRGWLPDYANFAYAEELNLVLFKTLLRTLKGCGQFQ